jgi:phospholipase/lecithinase/hemolysin
VDGQLQNHQTAVSRIASILGNKDAAKNHLNKCLYTVAIGDNDYIGNYFLPLLYNTSSRYSPEQFATKLIQKFTLQLTTLYNLGARKIAVFGIPPLDCSPSATKASRSAGKCVEERTHSISIFNSRLRQLVDGLNKNLTNSKFMSVNTYGISRSSLSRFKVTDAACCKVEERVGITTCIPHGRSCDNRNEYMWWDAVHQTEAAYKIIAERAYKSQSPSDTYPVDISRLVRS